MVYSTHLLEEIEQHKLDELEHKRQEILLQCIVLLKKYFKCLKVQSVYITGSLLVPYKFRSQSDIDIAVKGMPPGKYFTSVFELEELLSRKIEIIELENCWFAEKIIETGLKII